MSGPIKSSTSSVVFKTALVFAVLVLVVFVSKSYFIATGAIFLYAGLLILSYTALFSLLIWSLIYWAKRRRTVSRAHLPFVLILVLLTGSVLLSPVGPYFSYNYNDGFVSKLHVPKGVTGKVPAIIVLSGSDGGIFATNLMAESYAQQGYVALAVAYFKGPGLPKTLENIPLDYFERAFKVLKNEPMADTNKIAVVGASKGAELALLLASKYPTIKAVIALAPSCYVFQGIPDDSRNVNSSWTYHNAPVPFIPYKLDQPLPKNHHFIDIYKASMSQTKYLDSATIKVENINGPVLLVSGDDDQMWPSNLMSEEIVKRLNEHHFQFPIRHFNYKNAGHTFFTTMYGGTSDGNKAASDDSRKQISDFLKQAFR